MAKLNEQELRRILRAQASRNDARSDEHWTLASDCLENRQLAHTEAALKKRFSTRQSGSKGEQIQALTLPLVKRYIAEAASAYNRPVMRDLVDSGGVVDVEATKMFHDMIGEAALDEVLHSLEQRTLLLESSALLPGAKRGELTGQVLTPQQLHPVLHVDDDSANPADQRDYAGHVVDLGVHGDVGEHRWVFMAPEAHYYYNSMEWSEVGSFASVDNETWMWDQSVVTDDFRSRIERLPLQMLTYWHCDKPVGKLITPTDVPLARMNIEMNVQWSCLMDTLQRQGYGQFVFTLANKALAPSQVSVGSSFAIMLDEGETASSISHSNDWGGMIGVLKTLTKLFSILLRQSPSDFALDARGPESGFAKLVDSLPKIEARGEHTRRFKIMEEQYLWPRLASIGIYLRKLPDRARVLKLRTRFSELDVPNSVQERILEEEHNIKLGMTTAAKLLAQRDGIPEAEAKSIIESNLESVKGPDPSRSRKLVESIVAGDGRTPEAA